MSFSMKARLDKHSDWMLLKKCLKDFVLYVYTYFYYYKILAVLKCRKAKYLFRQTAFHSTKFLHLTDKSKQMYMYGNL